MEILWYSALYITRAVCRWRKVWGKMSGLGKPALREGKTMIENKEGCL